MGALSSFDAAVRCGGFRRAAEELGVSVGSVSRFVSLLEDNLGTILFKRTPTGVEITEAGQRYWQEVSHALKILRRADEKLDADNSQVSLRIGTTPTLGTYWFLSFVKKYNIKHPKRRLRLELTMSYDPLTEGDVDIFVSSLLPPKSVTRPKLSVSQVYMENLVPVVSSEFATQLPEHVSAEDLLSYPLLMSKPLLTYWKRWSELTTGAPLPMDNIINFDNSTGAYHAARAGHGVALGEALNLMNAFRDNELVAPVPLVLKDACPIYLVTRQENEDKPKVKSLLKALRNEMKETTYSFFAILDHQ